MQKRRKRKRGYGSWWLAIGQVAKGTFICGSVLWIALEKLKIMKRANMLGFYRKEIL